MVKDIFFYEKEKSFKLSVWPRNGRGSQLAGGGRRCGERILERRGRAEQEEKVRIVRLQVIVSKVKHSHNRYYVSSVPLEVAVYSDFTTA